MFEIANFEAKFKISEDKVSSQKYFSYRNNSVYSKTFRIAE